jgi:hypothetical protein
MTGNGTPGASVDPWPVTTAARQLEALSSTRGFTSEEAERLRLLIEQLQQAATELGGRHA